MSSQTNPASIAPALAPATSKPKETSTATPTKATSQMGSPPKKRTGAATEPSAAPKVTKRRAARACVSCRARKVRCDVVEGAPCGNCRWDNVECVVQESRRRKKNIHQLAANSLPARHVSSAEAPRAGSAGLNPIAISSSPPIQFGSDSGSSVSANSGSSGGASGLFAGTSTGSQAPQLMYPQTGFGSVADENSRRLLTSLLNQVSLLGDLRSPQFLASLDEPDLSNLLPPFIRPFPSKASAQDVKFLREKGALSLPSITFQNALLQAYAEYVHPYMPLLDMHEFLSMVHARDGSQGQVSLFLYQAVMFAATAFVDSKALRDAGYPTRKAARKAFFHRTRLLYDFDYELDRVVLVQGLLLKTFWYESPDDQKDTWHWMGVAISLAHTIGLHRNPTGSSMQPRKQKLWKRIWWSCFMRDRLIALGMRRPTRIKDEDFDVPMLEKADFDIECLPEDNTTVGDCPAMRDLAVQEELAELCIAKAQLCTLISRMLKAQYTVITRDKVSPETTPNGAVMLFPNKDNNVEMVKAVDLDLMAWETSLKECCQYRPLTPLDVRDGRSTIALHRTLLHMVYHTTGSALHRPQFLPASPAHALMASRPVQEMARIRVRDAAARITVMAADLHRYKLEKYLPTTGVTVVLPAMIIHLLDMKNPVPQTRDRAMRGFKQCMKVMEKLRDIYAAADYAAGFLDAALRKASIDINAPAASPAVTAPAPAKYPHSGFTAHTPPPENVPYMTATEALYTAAYSPDQQQQQQQQQQPQQKQSFTPPQTTATPLELLTRSPPLTDRDLEAACGMTPSASGSSDEMNMDYDPLQSGGVNEINWNVDVDMDQWLQFPPEGVSNTDDTFMAGMFTDDAVPQVKAEQAFNWVST